MTVTPEINEPTQSVQAAIVANRVTAATVGPAPPTANAPASSCPTCAAAASSPPAVGGRANSYIYALGQVEPRFPRMSVEKEFMQATGRAETAGLTDRQALQKVLSDPQNRYLARHLCWVMTIAGLDTYILAPRLPSDLDLLVESYRAAQDSTALDAVVGIKGPVASPDMCNGLLLPIVIFDQLYSFDRESLIKAIPVPQGVQAKDFAATAAEVLDRILAVTDNAGATDDHRALNYLVVRDPGIYARVADCYGRDLALTAVETRLWAHSTARKIIEALFTFTQRKNEFVEKYVVRVNVNDEFPFLVSKTAPYYAH